VLNWADAVNAFDDPFEAIEAIVEAIEDNTDRQAEIPLDEYVPHGIAFCAGQNGVLQCTMMI
jgi:hypothetical protein